MNQYFGMKPNLILIVYGISYQTTSELLRDEYVLKAKRWKQS